MADGMDQIRQLFDRRKEEGRREERDAILAWLRTDEAHEVDELGGVELLATAIKDEAHIKRG